MKLTTSILKILDLASNEVGLEFEESITGHQTYLDGDGHGSNEGMYSPYLLKELHESGEIEISDMELFNQIFKICEKKDCSYFRIVN